MLANVAASASMIQCRLANSADLIQCRLANSADLIQCRLANSADLIPFQARAAEAASAEASAQDAAKEMGKRAKELEAESETLRSELARAREVRFHTQILHEIANSDDVEAGRSMRRTGERGSGSCRRPRRDSRSQKSVRHAPALVRRSLLACSKRPRRVCAGLCSFAPK
jgi:hypothetical protein